MNLQVVSSLPIATEAVLGLIFRLDRLERFLIDLGIVITPKFMKTRIMKTVVVALMLSFVAGSSAVAVTIYNQPWDGTGGGTASQNDTSGGGAGNFATAYDNFFLAANAAIDSVTWLGVWFNPPTQGTITGFTLSFWADSAGAPGGLLQSYSIAGNASETFFATGTNGLAAYTYSANLTTDFNALAGTQYWLSIVPDTTTAQPQWAWASGTGGDGISYVDFFGNRSQNPFDLAFSLNSTNGNTNGLGVPESGSTALLLGSAVIGLGLLRKKFPIALR